MSVRIAPLAAAGLLVLGSIDAWLLSVVIEDIAPNDQSSVGRIEWKPKLSTLTEGMPSAKPIDAYRQTLAHPVFFRTREPWVAPPPPPPAAPKPIAAPPVVTDPGVALGGVIIDRELRKAYLLNKADRRGTWVQEGESFMGWKLTSVDDAAATLQQQGRTIELELYAKR